MITPLRRVFSVDNNERHRRRRAAVATVGGANCFLITAPTPVQSSLNTHTRARRIHQAIPTCARKSSYIVLYFISSTKWLANNYNTDRRRERRQPPYYRVRVAIRRVTLARNRVRRFAEGPGREKRPTVRFF